MTDTQRLRSRQPLILSLMSACLVFILYCCQEALRGAQPFGERSVQIGDQFVQYVPFAAEYRRILLGISNVSSYQWSWGVGGGTPMHGNIATYDGGLLFPLVLVVTPETAIETALFVIVGLSFAVAAAAMVFLLKRVQPELNGFLTVALASGYAMCAWAVQDASYVPMWLSGYYMLPLLALVAIRATELQGFLTGVLLVGLTWWSNYYTAFMASLGAAVFLLFWIAVNNIEWRAGLKAIAYFAAQGIVGVLLAAIFWLPTLRQVMNGIEWPGDDVTWVSPLRFLGHFLPWTEALAYSPSFAVSSLTIVLCLLTLSAGQLPRRIRVVSAASLAILFFSFAFPPTLFIWNVFDTPNGNLWRAAFVVAFMSTVIASYSARILGQTHWKDWIFPVIVLMLVFAVSTIDGANRVFWSYPALSIFLVVLIAYLTARSLATETQFKVAMPLLLVTAVSAELVVSHAWMLNHRDDNVFQPYRPWSHSALGELAARDHVVDRYVSEALNSHRVRFTADGVAAAEFSNRGLLLSLPGVAYYSTLTPGASLVLADELGVTSGNSPRVQAHSIDPVANSMMSVVEDLHPQAGRNLIAPMPFVHLLDRETVTQEPVHRGISGVSHPHKNVFEARNAVVGHAIYTPPTHLESTRIDTPFENAPTPQATRVTGFCPSGTTPTFDARDYLTKIRAGESIQQIEYDVFPLPEAAINSAGAFEFDASVDIEATSTGLPLEEKISCFDPRKYESALQSDQIQPRVDVTRFGEVKIDFQEPQTGVVVVKMPVIEGYKCEANDGPLSIQSLHGLLALPVDSASSIRCHYEAPWQNLSFTLSISAFLAAALITYRQRRG